MSDKVAAAAAKRAATRALRREEDLKVLRAEIRKGKRQGAWGLGYVTGLSDVFISKALLEDKECIELVKDGMVAVPARTLRHAAWVLKHVPDISKLPVVVAEEKLSTALLPAPDTGSQVLNANYTVLESTVVAMARRLPARKAREYMNEIALVTGQVIGETREMFDDNEQMAQELETLRLENTHLQQQNRGLLQKNQRLEARLERRGGGETDMPPPAASSASEGFRPHA